MRIALSVTAALVVLMLCTTLVVSEVSAAPVGFVTAKAPPNFFTMLHQWIMHFMQLFHCGGVPTKQRA